MTKKTGRRSQRRAGPSDPMTSIGDVAAAVAPELGLTPGKPPEVEVEHHPATIEEAMEVTGPNGVPVASGPDQLLDVVDKLGDVDPTATLGGMAQVMERLALNPNVDVDKLEKLFELQDRLEQRRVQRHAEQLFNTAFSKMQAAIPEVAEHGKIYDKSGKNVVSTYALNEDIQKLFRPLLAAHGFSLSYKTEEVEGGKSLRITGFLRHVGGHTETSEFVSPPDESGYKNKIQGLGSTRAYGRRYTAFDLLNITTRGEDDDGRSTETPEPPKGYEAWEQVMAGLTDQGIQVLQDQWNKTKQADQDFCDYATKYRAEQWSTWKAEAKEATAKKTRQPGEEG